VALPGVQEVQHLFAALHVAAVLGQFDAVARVRISPMVAAGPLVIITTRSDSSTASSTSWVTITTVLRVRATIFSNSS
jgi:ABC-type branched-subunit amino acid transport system substrate-binding protein